jgi:hypothetical protein
MTTMDIGGCKHVWCVSADGGEGGDGGEEDEEGD